jgi:hypothetical protein
VNPCELEELFGELPTPLREQLLAFSTYAEDSFEEICDALGVSRDSEQVERDFDRLATIWRLWQVVNGQYSLMMSSLRLLDTVNAVSFQLGRWQYSRSSEQVRMLTDLRSGFITALSAGGIGEVATMNTLRDVALYALRDGDGR